MEAQVSADTFLRINTRLAGLETNIDTIQDEIRSLKELLGSAGTLQLLNKDAIRLPVIETTTGRFHPMGYWIVGSFHCAWTVKQIYVELLHHLWAGQGANRQEMVSVARRGARIRRYVAKDPGELFPGKDRQWMRGRWVKLPDGWVADTNLSLHQMQQIIGRMLTAAGIKLGEDMEIVWTRREAR